MRYLYSKSGELFAQIKYTKSIYSNYKEHFHNELSFSFINSGSLRVYFRDKSYILEPNLLAIFNPFILHYSKNIDAKGYYTIYINNSWLLNLTRKTLDKIYLKPYFLKDKELISLIKALYLKESKELSLELEDRLKEIIFLYQKEKSNQNKQKILEIKEYINLNLEENLSLDILAKEFAYDKSYLIRLFKKEVGITPQNYIINQRVHRAKELITLESKINLASIATKVGFYDQSHLNRNFKKIFAIPPKEYK